LLLNFRSYLSGQTLAKINSFCFTKMLIRSGGNVPLFDTYHGVYISVKYFIRAKLKRGMLQSSPETSTEFYVEVPTDKKIIKSIKVYQSQMLSVNTNLEYWLERRIETWGKLHDLPSKDSKYNITPPEQNSKFSI